jgi:hypothetical protein
MLNRSKFGPAAGANNTEWRILSHELFPLQAKFPVLTQSIKPIRQTALWKTRLCPVENLPRHAGDGAILPHHGLNFSMEVE